MGSGADYLFQTVRNLESRGIHDRRLWRLQKLVAGELAVVR
jgi:cation transport protein ChaC